MSQSLLDMTLDEIVAASRKRSDGKDAEGTWFPRRRAIDKRRISSNGFGSRLLDVNRRGDRRGGHWQNDSSRLNISNELRHKEFRGRRVVLREGDVNNGTKNQLEPRRSFVVRMSGLDYSILEDDLRELFSSVGEIVKVWIDYDQTDRSKGTGGCIFRTYEEARRAVVGFNGRKLEGAMIHLELDDDQQNQESRRQRHFVSQDHWRYDDDKYLAPRDIKPW